MTTKIRSEQTQFADGWVSANETWTYASSTTFTVASDVTGKYQKGDKIKLTQTTVKYFYIIGVSESGGTTTITVTGGSDYTLANAAITANYYSHASSPVGFPSNFDWTPTYGATGSMTYTSVSTLEASFSVSGKRCFFVIRASGTTGGTTSNSLTFTVPITMSGLADFTYIGSGAVDDPVGKAAFAFKNGADNSVVTVRKYDISNYTIGAGEAINIFGHYSI